MHRAHRRDAVHTQKFFFRKDLYSPKPGHGCEPSTAPIASLNGLLNGTASANGTDTNTNPHGAAANGRPQSPPCSSHANSRAHSPTPPDFGPVEDEYAEFTIAEIINGDGKEFPGLMGVVEKYLGQMQIEPTVRKELEKSLQLIRRRADGALLSSPPFTPPSTLPPLLLPPDTNLPFAPGSLITAATFMRKFVRSHPAYKFDSVISEEINYDLIRALDAIERGERKAPEFLPACYKGDPIARNGTDGFKVCCGDVMEKEL